MDGLTRRQFAIVAASIASMPLSAAARESRPAPLVKTAAIRPGLDLHYVEAGEGTPVVFVHGSLSDYSYWSDQFDFFAQSHRTVAYSRRYNWPNANPARSGYSAVTDAQDLADLIEKLGLGRVHVVGHSYGALTALFLAARRPDLVRTIALAEPPAVSLLGHLTGENAALGRATLEDIRTRMVAPMRAAFSRGDREGGVAIFINYCFQDPHAWERFSPTSRAETMRDAHEWDVMMTTGELFPQITPEEVRSIKAPALLLSGESSYPFLALIDEELNRLLPDNHRVIVKGAGHQMWFQDPATCRQAVVALQQGR